MLNGCAFCKYISLAQAVRKKLGAGKFFALGDDTDDKKTTFSENEQAVIKFVDEYAKKRKITYKTFANLQRFFSEEEIIEIVAANAFEHYFNAFAVPLGIESDGLRKLAESARKDNED